MRLVGAVLIVLGFGLCLPAQAQQASQCASNPFASEILAELELRLCPLENATTARLLGILGQSGQADPDIVFLSRLLHRLEIGEKDAILPKESKRISDILQDNANLRIGLRAVFLSALFRPDELQMWCGWKAGTSNDLTRQQQDSLALLDRVIACGY